MQFLSAMRLLTASFRSSTKNPSRSLPPVLLEAPKQLNDLLRCWIGPIAKGAVNVRRDLWRAARLGESYNDRDERLLQESGHQDADILRMVRLRLEFPADSGPAGDGGVQPPLIRSISTRAEVTERL